MGASYSDPYSFGQDPVNDAEKVKRGEMSPDDYGMINGFKKLKEEHPEAFWIAMAGLTLAAGAAGGSVLLETGAETAVVEGGAVGVETSAGEATAEEGIFVIEEELGVEGEFAEEGLGAREEIIQDADGEFLSRISQQLGVDEGQIATEELIQFEGEELGIQGELQALDPVYEPVMSLEEFETFLSNIEYFDSSGVATGDLLGDSSLSVLNETGNFALAEEAAFSGEAHQALVSRIGARAAQYITRKALSRAAVGLGVSVGGEEFIRAVTGTPGEAPITLRPGRGGGPRGPRGPRPTGPSDQPGPQTTQVDEYRIQYNNHVGDLNGGERHKIDMLLTSETHLHSVAMSYLLTTLSYTDGTSLKQANEIVKGSWRDLGTYEAFGDNLTTGLPFPFRPIIFSSEDEIEGKNYVVLAFKGTASILDSGVDLLANLEHFDEVDSSHNVLVHSGFYSSIKIYIDWIVTTLANIRPKKNTVVLVTGHSAGGAMAILSLGFSAIRGSLENLHTSEVDSPHVITYGQPRMCNSGFRDLLNTSATNWHIMRINTVDDPVPLVPLRVMGYVHVGYERTITESGEMDLYHDDNLLDSPFTIVSNVLNVKEHSREEYLLHLKRHKYYMENVYRPDEESPVSWMKNTSPLFKLVVDAATNSARRFVGRMLLPSLSDAQSARPFTLFKTYVARELIGRSISKMYDLSPYMSDKQHRGSLMTFLWGLGSSVAHSTSFKNKNRYKRHVLQ